MNRNIKQTVSSFEKGEIEKSVYIETMYREHHASLFDYASFIPSTNISKIEIQDKRVIMTTRDRGIRMHVTPADYRTTPIESLNFGDYEPQETRMTELLVEDGSSVLDIGANIGWYSMNLAVSHRNAKIACFEPIPKTYAALVQNLTLNNISNVVANNFGLSNQAGTFTFYYYPEGSGNASSENLTGRQDVETMQCVVKTLDSLGASPDFIKCDVEGAELFVFQGGRETISRCLPIVFSEILRKWSAKFNYNPNEIFGFFRGLGYEAFTCNSGKLVGFEGMTEETRETNFFFLHVRKHADKIRGFT